MRGERWSAGTNPTFCCTKQSMVFTNKIYFFVKHTLCQPPKVWLVLVESVEGRQRYVDTLCSTQREVFYDRGQGQGYLHTNSYLRYVYVYACVSMVLYCTIHHTHSLQRERYVGTYHTYVVFAGLRVCCIYVEISDFIILHFLFRNFHVLVLLICSTAIFRRQQLSLPLSPKNGRRIRKRRQLRRCY